MKIAIIGASTGQLPLCIKAKEMGLETVCFAWEKGAVCRDHVDRFYPISVFEKERIAEICREEGVDGVVSNASDTLVDIVAYVAGQLGLPGNAYDDICRLKEKEYVRTVSATIADLSAVPFCEYVPQMRMPFDRCIVKPNVGAGKKGVFFVDNEADFRAVTQDPANAGQPILVERYVEGREISVESISCDGIHRVVQLTDKENSGPTHFVELSHHQPAGIDDAVRRKIDRIIPALLDRLRFRNGPSHVELKIDDCGRVYLIEVNPRGGGDEISNTLVRLSSGFDYVRAMIEVALGIFDPSTIVCDPHGFSGIYFLCEQTAERLPFFRQAAKHAWFVREEIASYNLIRSTGNYDRNGYVIYQSDHKIEWQNPQ